MEEQNEYDYSPSFSPNVPVEFSDDDSLGGNDYDDGDGDSYDYSPSFSPNIPVEFNDDDLLGGNDYGDSDDDGDDGDDSDDDGDDSDDDSDDDGDDSDDDSDDDGDGETIIDKINKTLKQKNWNEYRSLLKKYNDINLKMLSNLGYFPVEAYKIALETGHINNINYVDFCNSSEIIYYMFNNFNDYNDYDIEDIITYDEYKKNVLTVIEFLLDNIGKPSNIFSSQVNCIQDFSWIRYKKESYRSIKYNWNDAPKIIIENVISILLLNNKKTHISKLKQDIIFLLISKGVPIPDYIAYWKTTDEIIGVCKDYNKSEYRVILEYRTSYQDMISNGMVYLLKKLAYKKEYYSDIIKAFTNCDKYINEFEEFINKSKKDCDDNDDEGENNIVKELKTIQLNVKKNGDVF
jgi:hypothetical protein